MRLFMRQRPPRDAEISSHSLEAFIPLAHQLAAAALEGERRPDSTPEASIQRVLGQELDKREAAKNLRRLEDAERARKAQIAKVLKWAGSIIGSAIGGYVLHLLTTIHWH